MKRSLMTLAVFLVLATALAGTGCAPMPYQGSCYDDSDIIIIYEPYPVPVPVPYPVPVEVGGSEPLPERHSPLKKPRDTGSPRIKTPRSDRSGSPPVVARGGGTPSSKDNRTPKNPGRRSR